MKITGVTYNNGSDIPTPCEIVGFYRYRLIVPLTAVEIKEEGKKQGHCVGTYVDRVAQGHSIIVFLRKTAAPDVPFCTAEIKPGELNLIQLRAAHNDPAPADAKKWMDRYIKRIKSASRKSGKKSNISSII